MFQKLDKSKLPNLANAWPDVTQRLATYDPGNLYAANYMWGTTGIGYNVKKVQKILGPDAQRSTAGTSSSSRRISRSSRIAASICWTPPTTSSRRRSTYLGLDPNSTKQADLEKAADLVGKVRPYVRKFHSSEYLECARDRRDLPGGRLVRRRHAGAEAAPRKRTSDIEIGYAIPKEGAQMFFDNLAIPTDAQHVAEAYELINYLYRPEVAAKNSDFLSYANGNLASQKLIDPKILNDKTIYPDDATLKRLFVITARDPATQRIINRLWTRVKTGR